MNLLDLQSTVLSARHRVGPYIVVALLGRGAHGAVYLAHHKDQPSRRVALKLIGAHGNLDQLLVEPQILSRLAHPNIVQIHDYFLFRGCVVLILEYVPGQDLESYLRQRGKLTVPEVHDFLRQMAQALEHAHDRARNILHRDIKLSNILVENIDGIVRYVLTDFGVSRINQGIQLTKRTAGTYYYMAPEQLRGRPTTQSDLWSVGVAAYTLLSGHRPIAGSSLKEMSGRLLYYTPVPPSGGASPDLDRIIFQLLEKHAETRLASATELLRQLGEGTTDATAASVRHSAGEPGGKTQIEWSQGLLYVCVILWSVCGGVLESFMSLLAAYLIYHGYKLRQRPSADVHWTYGFGAVILFLAGQGVPYLLADSPFRTGGPSDKAGQDELITLFQIPWTIIGAYLVWRVQRRWRDRFLMQAILDSRGDPERLLPPLHEFVRAHPTDIAAYQRYVETLLTAGHLRVAAAEAQILLKSDCYNLGGNLLLATAYLEMGLYNPCEAVCDSYLSLVGYCFEFADLKERCHTAKSIPAKAP